MTNNSCKPDACAQSAPSQPEINREGEAPATGNPGTVPRGPVQAAGPLTRRDLSVFAAASAVAAVMPREVAALTQDEAASRTVPAMTSFFKAVADELEPAWREWQQSALAFEGIMDEASALMGSRDVVSLLRFRTGEVFVAFDMACRRMVRLREYAAWSPPVTEAERDLADRTTALEARMRRSGMFKAMSGLSRHIQKLDRPEERSAELRALRRKQQVLQGEMGKAYRAGIRSAA